MQDKGKTSYTPGPWKWKNDGICFALYAGDGTEICDDGSACGEYAQVIDPDGHNARLISKAPELVEILRRAVDSAHNSDSIAYKLQGVPRWAHDARALLAQIDGEG